MVVLFAIESRSSQDSLCYIHENSPLSQGATSSHGWRCALIYYHDVIDPGATFAKVTGLHSAASRSALQPAGCAGWIELLRYSLMPLGDFALAEITLFPPLINGPAATTAVSGSLRYRECLIGLSARIETSHDRLVSSLTHQVSLRSI